MKRRTLFWKHCELLFGLVQQEYHNHSQGMEQGQREISTKSSGELSTAHCWVSVQYGVTRTTHKLTHSEFMQVNPFIMHEGAVCYVFYHIELIGGSSPSREPQSFSVNFVVDIFLSLLRHLKLCQSGDLFPCT